MSWGDDAAKLHAKNLVRAQFIKGMHQRVCVAEHRLHLCDECHIRRVNAHALSDIFISRRIRLLDPSGFRRCLFPITIDRQGR